MYSRIKKPPQHSYFLFGPRATGKSTFLKAHYPHAPYIDLLDDTIYSNLLASPKNLEQYIPPSYKGFVLIDEIQKNPLLLDEVHRLMESKKMKFVLTGSSARKLKRGAVNMLAGRAYTEHLYPLTVEELGDSFDITKSLRYGQLPLAYDSPEPEKFLASYVRTYLDQEVKQEGFVRNLSHFTRFLQSASFSQGQILNVADVARDSGVERKTVEAYFEILEDLLLAVRVPVFTKKAKRKMVSHPKFYLFDAGVYQTIRPKGPLDSPEEIGGAALETLVFQELRAINDYRQMGYEIFYWHTFGHAEVDFILYGPKGIIAIEVKRSRKATHKDLSPLKSFLEDYPQAKGYFLYGGDSRLYDGKVEIWPVVDFLKSLSERI